MILRPILLLLVLVSLTFAQGLTQEYTATCTGTLSGSGTTATIQLPASSAAWVLVKTVFVQSTAQVALTQERDGTAATATAATIRKRNPNAYWTSTVTPAASVYCGSNVGVGTPAGTPMTVPVLPSFVVFDAEGTILEKAATGVRTYSVKLGTMTGDYTITFAWVERSNFP